MSNERMDMPQTVLVVDDSPAVLALVDETLHGTYLVRVASNGAMALAMLERDASVDLILMDVMMPGVDGFEVCRRIKATPPWRDIPLIFLTTLSEYGDEAYGLSLGAVDYIAKPVVPVTLRARVGTHMELCRMRRELEEKNKLLSAEREIIEGMILRMRVDPDFDGRHLRWHLRPVEQTGGDICLAAFCPDGRQIVLVGDFTGHGLTAAICGPMVMQAFYALCAQGVGLDEMIAGINRLLHLHVLDSQFMAANLAEVAASRQQVRLWGAGMPEPLYVDQAGVVSSISLCGFPLGAVPDWDTAEEIHTFDVNAGERILFHTDGSVEARSVTGEFFESDRLAAGYAVLLKNNGSLTDLFSNVDAFVGGQGQSDDMALLELTF